MNREQRRASKSNGRKMMKGGWSPFEDWTEKALGMGHSKIYKFFKNNIYTVQLFKKETGWGVVDHLMCRRNDESAVHSWQELQRIGGILFRDAFFQFQRVLRRRHILQVRLYRKPPFARLYASSAENRIRA